MHPDPIIPPQLVRAIALVALCLLIPVVAEDISLGITAWDLFIDAMTGAVLLHFVFSK